MVFGLRVTCCNCRVLTVRGKGCAWLAVGEVMSTAFGPVVLTGIVGNVKDNVPTLADRSTMSRLVVDGSECVLRIDSTSSKLDVDGDP